MGVPQILIIVLFSINLGINIAKHGEEKEEKYNFWLALIDILIECFILYCGGFFSK